MQHLLARLGNPQKELKCVHVAGTNGKGSTCALLASILQRAGYRTGLYTSPHLTDFSERIRIDGEEIPHDEVIRLAQRVLTEAEDCRAEGFPLTEFELITAMAFLWFREQNCAVCVLETGLGGRCDATNVIESPLLTVLTSISLDHTKILGDTIEQIAFEKSGILKPGVPCVCYPDLPRAAEGVIRTTAQVQSARLVVAPLKDLTFVDASLRGTRLLTERSMPLTLPLLGEHQMKNAAVVLACVKELRALGWEIPDSAVQEGFENVSFPARMEVLSETPPVLLDGAHNPEGTAALAKAVKKYVTKKRMIGVCGMMEDKNVREAVRKLDGVMEKVYTVAPDSPRAMSAQALATEWERRRIDAEPVSSVQEALEKALQEGAQRGVLVCGSLYLAGEARPLLKKLLNPA
ncbi:MAG TPA: bifunctional folylpolyglutamate synthase/dihydrofolate synthase [Candidatus Caccousia stercoris]|uniref:tetrahydrofolate synthase n=1 Tax=Candidatus Caccousia stercoris TaxID=2840723 RepID=A0A9D1FS09_9FIRM|nr:bifunctional folylpolyglutamate synthase/dihydrofolate synthase [Candidatus Caccousia stercoris]